MQNQFHKKSKPTEKAKSPWLSFLFTEGMSLKDLDNDPKEQSKLEEFEKGLAHELSSDDSIEMTLQKIVRMALAAEFGATFVKSAGATQMTKTIMHGIKSDPHLRKSALMIADKFAK
ncbi:MAG: hypothetical protein KKB81_07310 [Candidatus Margulisbacteria bacterium]|nr:hypothetical protein [Candidatus Margulisiibacteriota bacterium]MBU1021162.1 hypothetical protein [Candidatus Margulisiibacteriota bacterium]MBU1729768.1 hypothetical protein [Candidatus Margulisiibacteriota bacterium]MBU1955269.1 hypothetical protein [Candidatus Margulisiibacteriota bacterium]